MRYKFLRTSMMILVSSALAVSASATAADAHSTHGRKGSNGDFGFVAPNERNKFGQFHKGHQHGHHNGNSPVVLTSGLNNPRQLSLVHDAVLLVAEAGNGGTACDPVNGCVGATGSVSGVLFPQEGDSRDHTELVTGFLSGAGPDGSFAVGSDGVSQRNLHKPIYVQETFAPPDVLPAGLPGEQSGKLLEARPFESPTEVADITGFEQANDPDGQGFDSDPYAVVARQHDELVADAAGNDILRVDRHGNVSLFHLFPNVVNDATTTPTADWPGFDPTPDFPGADFVPTSIAIGPHGDVYVGGLSSELPGQAEIVKLDGRSGDVDDTFTGFSTITGLAVDQHGTMYVSQLEAPEQNPLSPEVVGVLTKVTRHGDRTDMDVPFPAGVAVDRWDNVYVSAFSIAPATGLAGAPPGVDTSGQIWRVRF